MAGDNKQKECKHCMTLISRRASICPQCRNSVARFSGLVSFVRTGAWFVTATVSLGFAAVEKWENLDLRKEKRSVEIEVDHEQAKAKVAKEVYKKQADEAKKQSGGNDVSHGGVAIDDNALKAEIARTEQQLGTIEERINKMVRGREKPRPIDLEKLEREKLQIEIKQKELKELLKSRNGW